MKTASRLSTAQIQKAWETFSMRLQVIRKKAAILLQKSDQYQRSAQEADIRKRIQSV